MAEQQDAKITVYWLDKSRSQRVLWLLEQCNLQYTIQMFKRGADMLAPVSLKKIHPLGKSPVIGIESPSTTQPLILAESGAIVEYICDYFGKHLVPPRWRDGCEGKVGGETEGWLRYRFFMHYAEGSLMGLLVVGLIIGNVRDAAVPFFIKPITRGIASKVDEAYLGPNFKTHFEYLESQLATSPDNGKYLCGKDLTAADIMMSFPLIAAKTLRPPWLDVVKYPTLAKYIERLEGEEAYLRSVKKIEEVSGEKFEVV